MSDWESLALAVGLVSFLMIQEWVRSMDYKIQSIACRIFGPAWVWAFGSSALLLLIGFFKAPPDMKLSFIAMGIFLAMLGTLFLLAWDSARNEDSD